jgi:hypothetical protein
MAKKKNEETEAGAENTVETASAESVQPVDELEALRTENDYLRARLAELEPPRTADVQPVLAKDPAVAAYELFCKGQAEGEYPAWAELPPQTQRLWRDSYEHVARGGAPRTDYEHAVKYLIVSAQ